MTFGDGARSEFLDPGISSHHVHGDLAVFRRRLSPSKTLGCKLGLLSQFNKIRNVVAHSCALNEDEITRFQLSVKDWFRIQS